MGAGKSLFRAAINMSKDACIKVAISKLPFVLLKIHVMTMVKAIAAMTNIAMLRMVGGRFQAGTQNIGRCRGSGSRPKDRASSAGGEARIRASRSLRQTV